MISLLRNINLTSVLIAQSLPFSTKYVALDVVQNRVINKINIAKTSLAMVLRPSSQVVIAEWLNPRTAKLIMWDINSGRDQTFNHPNVDLYCILVVGDRMLIIEKNCNVYIYNFVTKNQEEGMVIPSLCSTYYPMGDDGFVGLDNSKKICYWHTISTRSVNILDLPYYPDMWSCWKKNSALLSFVTSDNEWVMSKLCLEKVNDEIMFKWHPVSYSFSRPCKILLSLTEDYMIILDGLQVYGFHYDSNLVIKLFSTETEIEKATLAGNRFVYIDKGELRQYDLENVYLRI